MALFFLMNYGMDVSCSRPTHIHISMLKRMLPTMNTEDYTCLPLTRKVLYSGWHRLDEAVGTSWLQFWWRFELGRFYSVSSRYKGKKRIRFCIHEKTNVICCKYRPKSVDIIMYRNIEIFWAELQCSRWIILLPYDIPRTTLSLSCKYVYFSHYTRFIAWFCYKSV